ncbi:MAG: phage tail tape measure protein [Rhizobiales bacterium]|nr:phage tail tape measure protein [Hyphomicrobiales bacterium]
MSTEIASLYAKVGADTSEFNRKMKGVQGDMDDTGKKASKFGAVLKGALGAGALAGAAAVTALGGALVYSAGKAMDMEQAIADISAAMNLTGKETEQVGSLIRDLGLDPKLKVNAQEAADAIMMLGTAGLSVDEIMGGAARSTVLLANATGSDFASAAGAASDVMAIFGIAAKDMDAAVNGIVATTQASKFTFEDYALALAQGGGVAATVGVNFDDFNATIAAISPLFASGSDAGTSFKTMLSAMIPKSADAMDAMKQLGIVTADGKNQFFDAAGNMRSMGEIAGILNTALAGLSDEQKNQALSTIFGSDAMRAAAALAGYTNDEFTTLKDTMSKVDAEQAAATRMNTLGGQLEILRGIIDQTATDIGTAIMPQLRSLTDMFVKLASENGPAIVAFFKDMVGWVVQLAGDFGAHWPEISAIVTTAADSVGKDTARLLESLGSIGSWFTGDGSSAQTDWSKFWLGLLDITGQVVSGTVSNIANLVESFAVFGETMKAIGAGDWGKAAEMAGRGAELMKQVYSFANPLGMGFDYLSQNGAFGGASGGGGTNVGGVNIVQNFNGSTDANAVRLASRDGVAGALRAIGGH